MLNVREWAENELPGPDDVPLTEQERNDADSLLATLQEISDTPARMVKLFDNDIEVLQHGLFLIREVLHHRHNWLVDNESDQEYGREVLDSLRNVRWLYAHLESAKDQLPI